MHGRDSIGRPKNPTMIGPRTHLLIPKSLTPGCCRCFLCLVLVPTRCATSREPPVENVGRGGVGAVALAIGQGIQFGGTMHAGSRDATLSRIRGVRLHRGPPPDGTAAPESSRAARIVLPANEGPAPSAINQEGSGITGGMRAREFSPFPLGPFAAGRWLASSSPAAALSGRERNRRTPAAASTSLCVCALTLVCALD